MKKDIYIFRHGETEWNSLRKMQGIIDIPLNEKGREQATKIAKHLQDKGINRIYSSHLSRALETGKTVAKTLGVEIVINEMLAEANFGKAGKEFRDDLDKVFNGENLYEKWTSNDEAYDNMSFPEGETKLDVRKRAIDIVGQLATQSPDETVCFSSHGFVIKQLIIACGRDKNHKGLHNCEIVHFKFDTEKFADSESLEDKSKAFELVERINTQL